MRVIVTLTVDGIKETQLEGDAHIFDNTDYSGEGFDSPLRDIGMWVKNWRYAGNSGRPQSGKVFIPWSSILMIQTLDDEK